MSDGTLRFCARCIRPTAVYLRRSDGGTEYLCRVHARREGVLP